MPPLRLARLGFALAVALLLAAPAPAQDGPWLKGRLLVASPEMGDPNFKETVIYMLEHTAEGALGLVINRPIGELQLADLLDQMQLDSEGAEGTVAVYAGGPVEPNKSYVLHSTDRLHEHSEQIDDEVAVTAPPYFFDTFGGGDGPSASLLILGYSGWAPGQLESEMAQGAWEDVESDGDLVFDPDIAGKWERALQRVTIDL